MHLSQFFSAASAGDPAVVRRGGLNHQTAFSTGS